MQNNQITKFHLRPDVVRNIRRAKGYTIGYSVAKAHEKGHKISRSSWERVERAKGFPIEFSKKILEACAAALEEPLSEIAILNKETSTQLMVELKKLETGRQLFYHLKNYTTEDSLDIRLEFEPNTTELRKCIFEFVSKIENRASVFSSDIKTDKFSNDLKTQFFFRECLDKLKDNEIFVHVGKYQRLEPQYLNDNNKNRNLWGNMSKKNSELVNKQLILSNELGFKRVCLIRISLASRETEILYVASEPKELLFFSASVDQNENKSNSRIKHETELDLSID